MEVFSEEEENKLEYTNFYQDYVHLMEKMIDYKLKETHSEEQVDQFYLTFKENREEYNKINEDVMDLLFGLVDFQKFKSFILEYKKGCRTEKDADESAVGSKRLSEYAADYDEFMKEINSDPDEKSSGWVKKVSMKEAKDGFRINIWQKKNEVKGAPDWARMELEYHNVSDKEFLTTYITSPDT